MVPAPGLWVDGLAHAAQDAQGGAVAARHVVVAKAHQRADERGGGVELLDLRRAEGMGQWCGPLWKRTPERGWVAGGSECRTPTHMHARHAPPSHTAAVKAAPPCKQQRIHARLPLVNHLPAQQRQVGTQHATYSTSQTNQTQMNNAVRACHLSTTSQQREGVG